MPVVINDFEVISSGNGTERPPEPGQNAAPAQRPLSARQVARILKMAKERALRLHAD